MTEGVPGPERPHAQLADWRFVLAPPAVPSGRFARLVVLGGPHDAAARLRTLGLAERISSTLDGQATADAIVVLPPARPPIATLRASLAEHGQIYLEHDRSAAAGASIDLTALVRHGFAIDGVYAVPPLDQPRRFVPLDDSRMLRWYFATMYRPLTALQRAAAAIVPPLAALGLSATLARLARTTCVVARAAQSHPRPSFGAMLASKALGRAVAPQIVLIGDGGDRVVLLPFDADGGAAPIAAIKAPRTAAFEWRTSEEHARVVGLRGQLPASLRDSIPEPLALMRVGPQLVAAERFSPGRSMLVTSGRAGASPGRQVDDLGIAMRWLTAFHLATAREKVTLRHVRAFLVDQPTDSYVRQFGCTEEERSLFDLALAHAAAHEGIEIPIGRTHGDFAVWNVLRDGDSLAVVDWEGSGAGVGYADALHLVTSWDLAVRRPLTPEAERSCFSRLFLEPERQDRLHRSAMLALADYRRAVGIDERLSPLLLLHHRLELALRRRRQQADAGEAGVDALAANRAAAMVGVLATERRRLFGAAGPRQATGAVR